MGCCVYDIELPQQLVSALSEMAEWAVGEGLIKVEPRPLVGRILDPDVLNAVAPERCTAALCKR
jgi:hypothetical protein